MNELADRLLTSVKKVQMDVIILSGLSAIEGGQFSLKQQVSLYKDGMLMTYGNLQKHFGLLPSSATVNTPTPYLAGIYLYNFLTQRGINCGLINFLDLETKQFKTFLKQNPKVLALSSSFLPSIKAVKLVTRMIRKYAPDIKIIVGGPLVQNSFLLYQLKNSDYEMAQCNQYFFFLNSEKTYYEDIDLFIIEEQGEYTLYQVINAIKNSQDLSGIPNLAYYKNNRLVFTDRKTEDNPFSEDLVSWNDVPEEYIYPFFPVRGSRGCPYNCKYCNFASGKKFRLKSPEILAKEISALANTGKVRIIRFTDDNLFLTHKHVEEYCKEIIKVGKNIKWTSFIRASSINKNNINLLKDSGCILAQIGMESGDPNILKEMDKKDTIDNYRTVVELLNTHGICTQLYFIIGYPGETTQTIENTIQLINSFHHQGPGINHVMVFPFVLAPLAPIYSPENRKKYNLRGSLFEWSHKTMNAKEARKHALDFYFRLENVYPPYGIEEFDLLDLSKMKKVARLRAKIRKAEYFEESPQVIEQAWQELEEIVVS